jgi:hypothetical protein
MTKFMVPVAAPKQASGPAKTATGPARAAGTGAPTSLVPGMAGVRITDLSAAIVCTFLSSFTNDLCSFFHK